MSISNIGLFLLTIAPSILICQYIFRMDKYEREPRLHLFVCFLLGIFCTLPALNMEVLGRRIISSDPYNLFRTFLFATIIIGLTEEILKFFSLLFYAFPRKEFNEPMDGIVYSVMISMGFAAMENIMYVQANPSEGFVIALARAFTAVPAHGLFAIAMGFYVGKAKFETEPADKLKAALKGLGVAVLLHGIYDFLLIQELYKMLMVLATLSIVVGWYNSDRIIKIHQKASPFRDDHYETMLTYDLALLHNQVFMRDTDIIDMMLGKMRKKHDLKDDWGEVYIDASTGDEWLRFGVPSRFTEDLNACLVRFPGPNLNEIINLSIDTDENEIYAAAAYLVAMETYENQRFRTKLVRRLEEFDLKELDQVHRERFKILIEATDLATQQSSMETDSEINARATKMLAQLV
jgi:protease PrsW